MHRFFVVPSCIEDEAVTLSGDAARQIARVLRLGPGDHVVVLDGEGWEYDVVLDRVTPRQVTGKVTRRQASEGEPATEITLYQAILKADKFELVLQKGTELGVHRFVPVLCARSVPRVKGRGWSAGRYARWRKIITEAAEQAHRGMVPRLGPPLDFVDACDHAEGVGLIPWEEESHIGLRAALRSGAPAGGASKVSVFTGPEGGFTAEEIAHARASEIVPVSLGRRILRAETAALATVSAILYEFGELG